MRALSTGVAVRFRPEPALIPRGRGSCAPVGASWLGPPSGRPGQAWVRDTRAVRHPDPGYVSASDLRSLRELLLNAAVFSVSATADQPSPAAFPPSGVGADEGVGAPAGGHPSLTTHHYFRFSRLP